MVFFVKNRHFLEYSSFCQKSNFGSKIEFLVKNRILGQNSKFLLKTQTLIKKSKFQSHRKIYHQFSTVTIVPFPFPFSRNFLEIFREIWCSEKTRTGCLLFIFIIFYPLTKNKNFLCLQISMRL